MAAKDNFDPRPLADREYNKFIDLSDRRKTAVRVGSLDGKAIASANLSIEQETLLELKAIRIGIQLMLQELNRAAAADLLVIAAGE